MIDVFITQFAKAMSTSLMLDDSACIIRVTVVAHGTERNGRTVIPHLADAAVISRVGSHHNQGPVEIVPGYRSAHVHHILEHGIIVAPQTDSSRERRPKLGVTDCIDRPDSTLRREGNSRIDIEVVAIGRIRLDGEEMFHLLFHGFQVISARNVFCVEAISQEDQIDPVPLGRTLQGDHFIFSVFIVILGNSASGGIILVRQTEDNLAGALLCTSVHGMDGQCQLGLPVA